MLWVHVCMRVYALAWVRVCVAWCKHVEERGQAVESVLLFFLRVRSFCRMECPAHFGHRTQLNQAAADLETCSLMASFRSTKECDVGCWQWRALVVLPSSVPCEIRQLPAWKDISNVAWMLRRGREGRGGERRWGGWGKLGGVTNCSLVSFKTCSTEEIHAWYYKPCQVSTLGKDHRSKENLLLLFC